MKPVNQVSPFHLMNEVPCVRPLYEEERRRKGERRNMLLYYSYNIQCCLLVVVVCWLLLLLLLLLLLSPENFTNIISLDICGFIEDRIRISRQGSSVGITDIQKRRNNTQIRTGSVKVNYIRQRKSRSTDRLCTVSRKLSGTCIQTHVPHQQKILKI